MHFYLLNKYNVNKHYKFEKCTIKRTAYIIKIMSIKMPANFCIYKKLLMKNKVFTFLL